jgi:hypothetical protein
MDAGEALELAELDRRLRVTAQQVREAVRRHLDEEAVPNECSTAVTQSSVAPTKRTHIPVNRRFHVNPGALSGLADLGWLPERPGRRAPHSIACVRRRSAIAHGWSRQLVTSV